MANTGIPHSKHNNPFRNTERIKLTSIALSASNLFSFFRLRASCADLRDHDEEGDLERERDPQVLLGHALDPRVGVHDDQRVVWAQPNLKSSNRMKTGSWAAEKYRISCRENLS